MVEPVNLNRSSAITRQADIARDSTSFFGRSIKLQTGYILLALLLLFEWALFVQFFNRELAWTYPAGHDQAVYLSESYETFDHILNEGVIRGLWHGLLMHVPQGKMMHLQTSLLLLAAGPSRFTALSINFFYFALLQCLAFYVLVWLTKRWSVAFLGLGLLLTTHSRFLVFGGMADFRLDHIALCLFGVVTCLAIRSRVFAIASWSIATALATALLILFRFQSSVTVAASLGVLLFILGLMAWRSVDEQVKLAARRRIRVLLSVGGLITFLVLPVVWQARSDVIPYYLVVPGDTKVWAAAFGASDPFSYWTFYGHSLFFDHLGCVFCTVAAIILAVLLVPAWRRSEALKDNPKRSDVDLRIMLVFLAVMFLVPLSFFTLWPTRNPVVGNILVTPAVGLIVSAVVALTGRGNHSYNRPVSRMLQVLAASVLACGIFVELAMAARRTYLSTQRESVENVLRLYDDIAERSQRAGWATPRVSFDRVEDYLVLPVGKALSYERHGVLLEGTSLLGGTIDAVPAARAVGNVANSDFAILTDLSSPEGPGFAYPFNIAMQRIEPQLRATAEQFMIPVSHFHVFAHHFTLYMRPAVQVVGDSGGWITSDGLTLVAPAQTFRARPNIALSGDTILAEHLGKVAMKASILARDGKAVELPVEFNLTLAPNQAAHYKAAIHLDPAQLPADGDVNVRLSFDKFVVPKETGFNSDTRKLVVMTPKQIRLLP